MKRFFSALGLATALVSSYAIADSELVDVPAKYVFAPQGYDDNDNVDIVVDGYFPNTCYKLAQGEVSVDRLAKTITIRPQARRFDGICLMVLVPYTAVFHVGALDRGHYEVKVATTDGLRALFPVKRSTTSSQDEKLYAPIEEAWVETNELTATNWVYFRGRYTNSCMYLKDVKIIDYGSTIDVLPTIGMRDDDDDCEPIDVAYKVVARQLPTKEPGRYLVQVRGLSGRSFLNVFSGILPGDGDQ